MTLPEAGQDDVEVVQVERSVQLDAPVEDVWRSLSHLRELGDWLGLDIEGDPDRPLEPGHAARAVEPDGSVRHLLVSVVDDHQRVAWHWWRDDGELSAVQITVEPASAGSPGSGSVVRVTETLALAGAGAGGRVALARVGRLDDEWAGALGALGDHLARKLGVCRPR